MQVFPFSYLRPEPNICFPSALVYAYQFSQKDLVASDDPAAWKFSKARQNWLVRHIWYEDAVPEQYVPLVVHYSEGIKGGSRDVRDEDPIQHRYALLMILDIRRQS